MRPVSYVRSRPELPEETTTSVLSRKLAGINSSAPAMPTRNENSSVFQEAYPAPGTHVDVALFHTAEH